MHCKSSSMDLPGQALREAHLVQTGVQATVVVRIFLSSIPPSWLRGLRNSIWNEEEWVLLPCLGALARGNFKALVKGKTWDMDWLARFLDLKRSDCLIYSITAPTELKPHTQKENRILTGTDICIFAIRYFFFYCKLSVQATFRSLEGLLVIWSSGFSYKSVRGYSREGKQR